MSTQTTIDLYKRTILSEVVNNLDSRIRSEHIINRLNNFITVDDGITSVLTSLFNPPTDRIIYTDFIAKNLLGYLELYVQYILHHANSSYIDDLTRLSLSKYQYIIYKYTELSTSVENKEIDKQFKYTRYINFSFPKFIYNIKFGSKIFNTESLLQLSYNDVLSLPILKSQTIYPDNIIAYVKESMIHSVDYSSDNKNIFCDVYRSYGNHIGSVQSISIINRNVTGKDYQAALTKLTATGYINGFVAHKVYIKITNVEYSTTLTLLEFETSIDDVNYSNKTSITDISASYTLNVLEGIDTHIELTFSDYNYIAGTIYSLSLDYLFIDHPECMIKVVYNMIYNLSYIRYNDISENKLVIDNNVKLLEQETSYIESASLTNFQREVQNIIPVNSQIYSIDISTKQQLARIALDTNNNMSYKYNVCLADIEAIKNTYNNIGSIVFDPIAVDSATSLNLKVRHYIPDTHTKYATATFDKDVFDNNVFDMTVYSEHIDSSCILYTVILENEYGSCEVPILPKNYYTELYPEFIYSTSITGKQYKVIEPLILNDLSNSDFSATSVRHEPKFVYKKGYGIQNDLYSLNPVTKESSVYTQPGETIPGTIEISLYGALDVVLFKLNRYYVFKGTININSYKDIISTDPEERNTDNVLIWSKASIRNNIYYMFYRDEDENIMTCIKTKKNDGILYPFTGKIYGKVTMMSSDDSYISPYVFDYALGCV